MKTQRFSIRRAWPVAATLFVVLTLCVVASVFALPTTKTATLSVGQSGLIRVYATWTMGQGETGYYKFQPVEVVDGNYGVLVYDSTLGSYLVNPYYFNQTLPPCTPSTPTMYLQAGHKYSMWVDIPLGYPVPGPHLDETLLAKCKIFYTCSPN